MWARVPAGRLVACTARARVPPQRCAMHVLAWTPKPQREVQRVAGVLSQPISERDWAGLRRWFATEVDDNNADGTEDGESPIVKRKKKLDENFYGIAHIQATFNNTIVNITDVTGATLCWSSGGEAEGYRGSRKKSPFAGQLAAEKAAEKAMLKGVRSVRVRVKGVGRGRETALRALITSGLEVTAVEDVTPIPHNGCRPKKSRRL